MLADLPSTASDTEKKKLLCKFIFHSLKGVWGGRRRGIMLFNEVVRKLRMKREEFRATVLTDEVVLLDLTDEAGYLISYLTRGT